MRTFYEYFKATFALVCMLGILVGCKSKTPQKSIHDGKIAIEIDTIALQRIDLDETTTTYEIESGVNDESIYVIDKYLTTLNFYDQNGRSQSSHLGAGRASNETTIGHIIGHSFLPDGDLVIFNTSAIFMLYGDDLCMKDWFRIDYTDSRSQDCYDVPKAYTQRYNRLVCRGHDSNIYCNVELATPETNMVVSGKEYLQKTSNILEIDIEKKSLGRLFAKGFPESYSEEPSSKIILSSSYFDIDEDGTFYVTYEADSSIYVYDKNNNEIGRFGFAGRDMNTDYVATPALSDVRKNYSSERKKRGYYNWIEYDDVNGLLFRSYQKGEGESTDGLQIYRGHDLIADLDVPAKFRVMGYIKPYYYSYVVPDEDAEKLYLYRFAL